LTVSAYAARVELPASVMTLRTSSVAFVTESHGF
jgi:hypothetical protein